MDSAQVMETFIKNFNVNADITDVNFRKFKVEPYHPLEQDQQFGEKDCLMYHCECTVYNINVTLKILSFAYECHCEVLKLEIAIHNELLSKEMAPCRNFLQRKRNINLVFEVLVKFTKLFEMRRLICQTVFHKQPNVLLIEEENSVLVKCCNGDFSVKYLEVNWTINWNVDTYEVSDFIEFYCNHLVVKKKCGEKIRERLKALAHPNLDFHPKLKLWKMLIKELYEDFSVKNAARQTSEVCEIIDSDSDDSVIEVDDNILQESISDEVLVIE